MGLSGSLLAEVDFSGIEAVLVGWFARDPDYIRLAKLGVHAGLASHVLGTPFDPSWLTTRPDDLRAYLAEVKDRAKHTPVGLSETYDVCKRVVHGSAYCLTPHGMVNNFPEAFPTVAMAKRYQDIYFGMAPTIPAWQKSVQKFAYDHGYLGGPGEPPFGHPFAYKHWFWAVGEYAKRAVAFYPQSTGRGILTEAMLRLFDPEEAEPDDSYIGDAYFGRTPLRAPIHDSLFLELPRRIADRVLEIVVREMTRPVVQMPNPAEWSLGSHLVIDVEAKVGSDWASMEKWQEGEAVEPEAYVPEESDEDDVAASTLC